MHKPIVTWLHRFDLPEVDRQIVFDFGQGPTIGNYDGNQFFSLANPGFWDRVLINKWCYLENYIAPINHRV
jgi:hypothetical protein